MSKVLSITKGTGGGGGGTITLTGDVTGSGTSSITTTIATDRQRILMSAAGIITENYRPDQCNGLNTTVSSTRVYGSLLPLIAGEVVTNVIVAVRVLGVGTAPTHIYVGLADISGAVVAVSNELAASTDWTAGQNVAKVEPFSSPYTVPTTGGYYAWIWASGTWATTQMALLAGTATNPAPGVIGSGKAFGVTTTTASVPVAGSTTFTFTSPANASSFWMALS